MTVLVAFGRVAGMYVARGSQEQSQLQGSRVACQREKARASFHCHLSSHHDLSLPSSHLFLTNPTANTMSPLRRLTISISSFYLFSLAAADRHAPTFMLLRTKRPYGEPTPMRARIPYIRPGPLTCGGMVRHRPVDAAQCGRQTQRHDESPVGLRRSHDVCIGIDAFGPDPTGGLSVSDDWIAVDAVERGG
jgi:hypothetical protein